MKFNDNTDALNAIRFINSTNRPVFLTGKAGTGKTTLLKFIVEHTHKSVIIAAPTGIAAINAGGVTLHSLFQLPFGAFIPSEVYNFTGNPDIQIHTRSQLLKKLQMNTSKRNMLRKVELLIIDEVSMLRADLLDAVDTILRHVRRRKSTPFGGVQVLFIGDMLQLPPVVKDAEQFILQQYYKSQFFFDAQVFSQYKPITIELSKIYRQTDKDFIKILNELRNNELSEASLHTLNNFYKPSFKQSEKDAYIFITTHNRKADDINNSRLKELTDPVYQFNPEIKGDFPDYLFPIEHTMQLKRGAQVMFLKNDYSGKGQYYNGKIGHIESLSKDTIKVGFKDGSESVWVEKYTWENKRFTLNKDSNEIEEKVLGTFTHYPLKLAWAVTVHKSQGLTFKQAIIDVSEAFAPGQIYVALSRLESLDGLVLSEPIDIAGPNQSERLLEFTNRKLNTTELETEYKSSAQSYMMECILDAFDFESVKWGLQNHIDSFDKDENRSSKQKYLQNIVDIQQIFTPLIEVSKSFQKQLQGIINSPSPDEQKLLERVTAAQQYFIPKFHDISKTIFQLISEIQNKSGIKKFVTELTDLELLFFSQVSRIEKALILIKALKEGTELSKTILQKQDSYIKRAIEKASTGTKSTTPVKTKEEKKPSHEISYEYLQKGFTPDQIAKERGMSKTTIETHLLHYVAQGILDARDFVEEEKIIKVIDTSLKLKSKSLKTIKDELGDSFSYTDIKFAIATLETE